MRPRSATGAGLTAMAIMLAMGSLGGGAQLPPDEDLFARGRALPKPQGDNSRLNAARLAMAEAKRSRKNAKRAAQVSP